MSITSAPAGVSTERIEAVRAMLAKAVSDGFYAGVAACAVQRGELLHRDAFGHRDVEAGEPMTMDTIFRIASSTKPIIAAAMMILREEGRWDFDDEVARYIPAFADLQVQEKDGSLVAPVQPMRMRHLMSHGIGFGATRTAGPDGRPSRPKDLPDLIERLASKPMAFHPGKRFLYGACCDVQGHVIEQLSGQSLDVFLRERIFEPLGMTDTGFWVEASKTDRVASIYDYTADGGLVRLNRPDKEQITKRPSYLSGGGGLWSTPDDYQRFCQMLVDEGAAPTGRVLQPESVRAMHQDLLEPQVYVRVVPGYTLPGARFGTNMSVITEPQGDNHMFPAGTYSWGGAFGTYFWIDPVNQLFVSGMVQIANGGAQHLGRELPYPDLKKATAELLYG